MDGMDEGKPAQHSNMVIFKKKVQDQRLAGRVRTGRRKTLFGRKKTLFGRPIFFSDIPISKKVQAVSGRSVLGVCALIQFQPLQ